MTKKEKELVQKAIDLFCEDGGWADGMDILKKLINKNYKNPLKDCPTVKYVDITSMIDEISL